MPDGNQVAFIKQTGSMSQSVFLTAGVYNVSVHGRPTGRCGKHSLPGAFCPRPTGAIVADVIPSDMTTATLRHSAVGLV